MAVHEEEINIRIASALSSDFGIDSRAERTKHRKRPDIVCYENGLLIGIECSYQKSDAEKDALARIKQQYSEIVIALWYKEEFPNVSEQELLEKIKTSTFDIKVFVASTDLLTPYLEQKGKKTTSEGWFTDIALSDLKDFIKNSTEFLVHEEKVAELTAQIKSEIFDFVSTMSSLDKKETYAKQLYDLFWRLYGLSLGKDYKEIKDVIFGQAALSILLSSAFYEHSRNFNEGFESLHDVVRDRAIQQLNTALKKLLKVDYKVALENTTKVLGILPSHMNFRVKTLAELGAKVADNRVLLKRDFAGRVYHQITGELALKKGLATYYTQVPAAYLIANLALRTTMDGIAKDKQIDKLSEMKIGDFACGSGTLLTAAYYALDRWAARAIMYDEADVDLETLGKDVLEKGLYGADALRYACQITAISLALMSSQNLENQNIGAVYLGYLKTEDRAWLGSLELLEESEGRFGGLLAFIEGGLKGKVEQISVKEVKENFNLPDKFDIVIMNPPFTRATGRGKGFDKGRAALFGFIIDEESRVAVTKRYSLLRDTIRKGLISNAKENKHEFPKFLRRIITGDDDELRQYLSLGQAGEGLLFIYLAFRYVRPGGTIAFVLPRNLLSGISWFLARILLSTQFHLSFVIVSNDPSGYNFSENTDLSETLIVAKRVKQHEDNEETFFVNLINKPDTAIGAMILADKVVQSLEEKQPAVYGAALLKRVKRAKLLENVDNWNRFVAVADLSLSEEILKLIEDGEIGIGKQIIKLDLVRFGSMIRGMGVNRGGDIIEAFNLEVSGGRVKRAKLAKRLPGSKRMLVGGEEELRDKLEVRSNGWVIGNNTNKAKMIIGLMSRLLVPDRIRWNTTGVISLRSSERLVANRFFMVTLAEEDESRKELCEKAMVVWLNTTWGLLTVLLNREETEGAFTRLNIGQWKLLPVLNLKALDDETLGKLSDIFDRLTKNHFIRLPEQFRSDGNKVRLNLDLLFLKAMEPKINEKQAAAYLETLYSRIDESLTAWLSKESSAEDDGEQTKLIIGNPVEED
ncbi:MAG: DNA methyltransferase family protein [Nitrososphaerales archaeon]